MRLRITILLLLMVVCSACSAAPHADVAIRQNDSNFDFQFRTRGVNSLLSLRLWQAATKKVFWDVNLNYYNDDWLRYGDVPDKFITFNGGQNRVTQNIPHGDQRPRRLPPNQTFYVAVDCQYDTFLAAAFRTFYFSFSTDKAGRIGRVTRIEHITSDALPNPQ